MKLLVNFNELLKRTNLFSPNRKMLLFNVTGDRDAEKMLQILHNDGIFDCAMFSPNLASFAVGINSMQSTRLLHFIII